MHLLLQPAVTEREKKCKSVGGKTSPRQVYSYCCILVQFVFTHFLFQVTLASVLVQEELIFTPLLSIFFINRTSLCTNRSTCDDIVWFNEFPPFIS